MDLPELHSLSRIDLLKYLAYLQVCPENSSHLQTLQDLQNRVLNGEDITADELVKKCEVIPDLVHKEGNKIPDITLSMGIAKGTENDTTDTLFKKADTALYSSKRTGRHCITVYTEGMK